jgi:hypothetical protein
MLKIAGGIILAVIFFALLQYIVMAGFWLILIVLGILAVFLIFGTEFGREAAMISGGLAVLVYLLGALRKKAKDIGGLDLLLKNFICNLQPAITEKQKIQKAADRAFRLQDASEVKAYRERRADELAQKRQQAFSDRLEQGRLKAHDQMAGRVRRLDSKFAAVGNLHFEYSDPIKIYRLDSDGYLGENIVSLGCLLDPDNPSRCVFEIKTSPRFGYVKPKIFYNSEFLLRSVRKLLRSAAAENVARK